MLDAGAGRERPAGKAPHRCSPRRSRRARGPATRRRSRWRWKGWARNCPRRSTGTRSGPASRCRWTAAAGRRAACRGDPDTATRPFGRRPRSRRRSDRAADGVGAAGSARGRGVARGPVRSRAERLRPSAARRSRTRSRRSPWTTSSRSTASGCSGPVCCWSPATWTGWTWPRWVRPRSPGPPAARRTAAGRSAFRSGRTHGHRGRPARLGAVDIAARAPGAAPRASGLRADDAGRHGAGRRVHVPAQPPDPRGEGLHVRHPGRLLDEPAVRPVRGELRRCRPR